MEEVISATSHTGPSWEAQSAENYDMDIAPSTNNINEIMPTPAEFSRITPPMDENNTILPNQQQTETQLMALIENFTGADSYGTLPNQTEETNEIMNALETSWYSLDQSTIYTHEASTQQKDLTQPVAEATLVLETDQNIVQANQQSWLAQKINTNQSLLANQLVQINKIMPVTDRSWLAEIVNINQVPLLSQAEPIDSTTPTAEPSLVEFGAQPVVDTNQAGLQWGVVALVYPDQDPSNQLEGNNTTMPASDNSEVAWTVHPYIQASLNSLNDSQILGQHPMEHIRNSPSPLAIVEEVQPSYQTNNNATITIPLITDPNAPPELITFRPGIYEGDEIPPVYSNFSIIAAPSDYEPLPPVYPELSIIPEPTPEDQITTEPINVTDVITTVDQSNSDVLLTSDVSIAEDDIEGSPQDTVEQELPTITSEPSTTNNSGYRGVDSKWLATLRHTKLVLIYEGYHYRRYYRRGTKIRWQCVSQRCEAFLYSVGNKISITHPVHNHLTIISQDPISVQETETNTALSLEDASSAIADADSFLADDDDVNDALENDKMILSHDSSSRRNSEEYYDNAQVITSVADSYPNNFGSNVNHLVLTSGNTIIPHDPSLEITVKSPSAVNKTTKEDLATSITTTMTSVPDPLGICVTTYTPPVPYDASDLRNCHCSNASIPSNINYMTVPEDTKVKVTISTKPRTSEPRVYYDGKLAPKCTTRRKATCTLHSTDVPTTSRDATIRTIDMSNAPSTSAPSITLYRVIPYYSKNKRTSVRCRSAQNAINPTITFPSTCTPNGTFRTIQNPYISNANDPITTITAVTANIQTLSVASSSTNTLSTTNTTKTFKVLAGTRVTAGNRVTAGRPLINIPRSQIVAGSDPEYSQLYNTFVSRAQTSEQQVSHRELPSTEVNMPLANTSSAVGSGRNSHISHNPTVSTTMIMSTVRRPGLGSSIRNPNPHVIIPRSSLRRTMIPTGYSLKRSIRLARARNVQSYLRRMNNK